MYDLGDSQLQDALMFVLRRLLQFILRNEMYLNDSHHDLPKYLLASRSDGTERAGSEMISLASNLVL